MNWKQPAIAFLALFQTEKYLMLSRREGKTFCLASVKTMAFFHLGVIRTKPSHFICRFRNCRPQKELRSLEPYGVVSQLEAKSAGFSLVATYLHCEVLV